MIEFKCPKCGAKPDEHGKGGQDKCRSYRDQCSGFICECEDDDGSENHGQSFEDICTTALCHHCGWHGKFPVKPKGLSPWEKKALDEGWVPPESRRKELGL